MRLAPLHSPISTVKRSFAFVVLSLYLQSIRTSYIVLFAFNVLKRREKENYLEDPGVDGRIILKFLLWEIGFGGEDCICITQNRNRWQDFFFANRDK